MESYTDWHRPRWPLFGVRLLRCACRGGMRPWLWHGWRNRG